MFNKLVNQASTESAAHDVNDIVDDTTAAVAIDQKVTTKPAPRKKSAAIHLNETPDLLTSMRRSAEAAAAAEPDMVQIMLRAPREDLADLYYLVARVSAAAPTAPSRFGISRIIIEICKSLLSSEHSQTTQASIIKQAAQQVASATYHRRRSK